MPFCAKLLYLIEFLHQTTTERAQLPAFLSCILLNFYIKPQLASTAEAPFWCCILLNFYIKPQQSVGYPFAVFSCILLNFYIKPQLLCCVLSVVFRCILLNFYIKPQRLGINSFPKPSCILLNFYIKPQPRAVFALILWLLCPVSRLKKTGLNSAEVDLMSFFRISKNKYSQIFQKNSNCWGISGLARSLFPQKFRISPYCLSVTARMLVYPDGGIERLTRLM